MQMHEQETTQLDMNESASVQQPDGTVDKSTEDIIREHIETVDKKEAKAEAEEPKVEEAKPKAEESTEEPQELPAGGELPKETAPQKFEPQLTYTYRGKKFDMPEELKGVIDSPEKQEFYEDLFTKAKGLEVVKAQGLKAQENLDQLTTNLDQFYQHINMGDFAKAFEIADIKRPSLQQLTQGLGFSKRDIIEYAYELANETPEQEASSRMMSEAERKYREAEMRIQQFEANQQRQTEQMIYGEFQDLFQEEGIADMAQAFDQKYGEGSFVREVALRGEQIHRLTGQVERPRKLVNEIIDRYNLRSLINQSVHQEPVTSQPARNNKPRTTTQSVPVIPAIDGSGGSPSQRSIRSLEDIEKIYQEKFGPA